TRNAQVYATLTMCRALYTVRNGDFVSKRQAALWAAREMPEWRSLIENALRAWREDWYNDQMDHQATLPDTRRFVNAVIDRIVD
ncbi:MAG TPA: aminoglycoside adenylyltransferase domain-containing protein, partial [Chloroflexota bacterium]|nr:aminoglycoside adenylyltransferase domain-containing protein [Chloroflexota bacterium]